MSAVWRNIRREPVRWLSGFQIAWVAAIGGLIVFNRWTPTPDQLQWTLGVPVVAAGIFGWTIVRGAVTPNAKLPARIEDAAERDRLVDAGLSTIQTILVVVLVILAFFGAAAIFGWSLA